MAAPSRTMTTTASVKRIRRRSSGILSVLTKAETILLLARSFLLRGRFRLRPCLRLRFVALRRLTDILRDRRRFFGRAVAHCNRSASLLDLRLRRLADFVSFDLQRVLHFAVA